MGQIDSKFAKIAECLACYQDDSADFKRSPTVSIAVSFDIVNNIYKTMLSGNGKSWIGEGPTPEAAIADANLKFKQSVNEQILKEERAFKNRIKTLKSVKTKAA